VSLSSGPDQNRIPTGPLERVRSGFARARRRALRPLAAALGPALPWLALAALWLLFELPLLLRGRGVELSRLRLSLELPLLLTLWGVHVTHPAPALRWLLRLAAACLVLYRIDQWIFLLLMREEPLLYDQWFMLRHLGVLIGDLMSLKTLLVLCAAALTGWLLSWLARRLLARARSLLDAEQRRRTLRVARIAWAGLLLLSAAPQLGPLPRLGWLTPALARNLAESSAVYRSVRRQLAASPYAGYAQLRLRERPDVLLFIVESYGRLLSAEPELRERHGRLLRELQQELARAGWHAASAFGTAPVSGGRSWIAEGTLLLGTPIRYEAVFQHIVAQRPHAPNLVSFLNQQGYQTVLLAPSDRNRPGAHVINRYQFEKLLTFEQMGYRGPRVGWGIVPDQHSLAVAERKVLRPATRPVFLDFHMVSSHAPWSDVPLLAAQPEAIADAHGTAPLEERTGVNVVLSRLEYYERDATRRYAYMNRFDAAMREGYRATIEYDLRLITQYLARRSRDALVVVLGDHQPPVIAPADASFDAPIHILSRSPERLQEVLRQGFVPGLEIPREAPARLAHAGLFSLLVRSLVASSCAECELPPWLREGAPLLVQ
jgi:hypothetical protein